MHVCRSVVKEVSIASLNASAIAAQCSRLSSRSAGTGSQWLSAGFLSPSVAHVVDVKVCDACPARAWLHPEQRCLPGISGREVDGDGSGNGASKVAGRLGQVHGGGGTHFVSRMRVDDGRRWHVRGDGVRAFQSGPVVSGVQRAIHRWSR